MNMRLPQFLMQVVFARSSILANTASAETRCSVGHQTKAMVALAALLSACGGGGGGGGGGGQAQFSVAVGTTTVNTSQGSSTLLPIKLTRNQGFAETVTVSVDSPPAGVESDTVVFSGATTSALLPVSVTDAATLGSVTLNVAGKSGSASHKTAVTLAVAAPQPKAQEKIAAALSAGTIDYGTSLLYRLYALLGDKRLPSEFQGAGSVEEDNGLYEEIRKKLGSFPADVQAKLQPFIVRPVDPLSVWNATAATATAEIKTPKAPRLRRVLADAPPGPQCPTQSGVSSWVSQRSASNPVRVWAPCKGEPAYDAESQNLLGKTLAVLDKIYGPMTALMGAPILDQEGGDDAIDFYILDSGAYVFRRNDSFEAQGLGSTYSDFPEVNNGASAFVTLPRFLTYIQRFHTTVIHEFFHVLQKRHNHQFTHRAVANVSNVYEQHWFGEASAVWASAHFDRTLAPWDNGRAAYSDAHQRFVHRFQVSTEALNATTPEPHTYSAYIWPYFVEQEKGGPDFMGQIWAGLETVTSFDQADDVIDTAHPFAQNFKTFATRNLNMPLDPGDALPVSKRYVNLDSAQFPDKVPPSYMVTGTLVADQEYRQNVNMDSLSARYFRLGPDARVKKVELDFSGLQPQDLTDVQVFVRSKDGDPKDWITPPFDFSNEDKVVFCLTDGPTTSNFKGDFVDMIIVVSNHAKRDKVSGALVARPDSKPCSTVWKGSSTIRSVGPNGEVTDTGGDVVFEFDDTVVQPGVIVYRLRSGNVSHLFRHPPVAGCGEMTVRGSGPMLKGPFDGVTPGTTDAKLEIFLTTSPPSYTMLGATLINTIETGCHGDQMPGLPAGAQWAYFGQNGPESLSEDGNTIQGSRDTVVGGDIGTVHEEWLFTKVKE